MELPVVRSRSVVALGRKSMKRNLASLLSASFGNPICLVLSRFSLLFSSVAA